MTAPTSAQPRPNLLHGDLVAVPPPVFSGPQRTAALNLLANAIVEGQVMAVMRLLAKDPSLCLEAVPVKATGSIAGVNEVPFAKACLDHDMSAGYVFAVARGYDATHLLEPALVKMSARGESVESDMALLLSMGADPNAIQGDDSRMGAFGTAMFLAYPHQKVRHAPGLVTMMLDAGASPVYSDNFLCPYCLLIRTGGWDDDKKEARLFKQMARLSKAGLSLERATGNPKQTPLMMALGSKNGKAVCALVRLGAKTDSDHLRGNDLYTLMDANGLSEFKPLVQEAVMERRIAEVKKDAGLLNETPGGEAAVKPARPVRRLGAL